MCTNAHSNNFVLNTKNDRILIIFIFNYKKIQKRNTHKR